MALAWEREDGCVPASAGLLAFDAGPLRWANLEGIGVFFATSICVGASFHRRRWIWLLIGMEALETNCVKVDSAGNYSIAAVRCCLSFCLLIRRCSHSRTAHRTRESLSPLLDAVVKPDQL